MKQPKASSIATLRVSAVLAMLWALPVGPVSATAIPMPLASGSISLELLDPTRPPFPPVAGSFLSVFLENHDRRFALFASNPFGDDRLIFTDWSGLVPPPSTVDFTAELFIVPSLFSGVDYLDEEYRPSGVLNLFAPSVPLGPVPPEDDATTGVTLPFTLSGTVIGDSRFGHPSVAFDITGRGTMSATFDVLAPSEGQPAAWELQRVDYFIEPLPVPEPATWVLVGSGLLAVARRRSARRN